MPMKKSRKRASRSPPPTKKMRDVLDVGMTAELLMVSTDTVYDLLKRGELPGRKVGRKWLTTRNAVLRWIESSSGYESLARAIGGGDKTALSKALSSGKATVR
jgi:excisionase family DNA binding protein